MDHAQRKAYIEQVRGVVLAVAGNSISGQKADKDHALNMHQAARR
jgi:hypothetical protein